MTKILILTIPVTLLTTSCAEGVPTVTPTPTQSSPPQQATVQPSPTPITPKIILWNPNNQFPWIESELEQAISAQITGSKLRVITTHELSPDRIPPGTQTIFVLPPDPGIQEFAEQLPEILFVSVGIANLQPSDNLALIAPLGFHEDYQAFIAGYLAAVITTDWRVGMILQSADQENALIRQAFVNGFRYYCGLCRLTYPPFHEYPILLEIPAQASEGDWQDAVDTLASQSVNTAFLYTQQSLLPPANVFSKRDLSLIGVSPPEEGLTSQWVATIRPMLAASIEEQWETIQLGTGGWIQPLGFQLEDVNQELLSPGRKQFVEEMMADLLAGFISPITNDGSTDS